MPCDIRIEDHEATIQAELDELWRRWNAGELSGHIPHLKRFVTLHRADLVTLSDGRVDSPPVVVAIKRLLIKAGTVHPPVEMRDQLREIHNEIWYHGERGQHDPELVAQDWTTKHARNWRRWRLKEYLFVADRISVELQSCLFL